MFVSHCFACAGCARLGSVHEAVPGQGANGPRSLLPQPADDCPHLRPLQHAENKQANFGMDAIRTKARALTTAIEGAWAPHAGPPKKADASWLAARFLCLLVSRTKGSLVFLHLTRLLTMLSVMPQIAAENPLAQHRPDPEQQPEP